MVIRLNTIFFFRDFVSPCLNYGKCTRNQKEIEAKNF